MRADLRQQAFGTVLRRLAHEHGTKVQPAANRFFDDTHAFDGAVTVFGALTSRKSLAQLFHQRMVPAFDAAQALPLAGTAHGGWFGDHNVDCIIRRRAAAQLKEEAS